VPDLHPRAGDYDRFSVVAFAPPDIRETVDALRRTLPPSGRPILQAHVTLKGTFVDPQDLDEIATRVRQASAEATPFTISTTDLHLFSGEGGALALMLDPPGALLALHHRLVEELRPLCRTIYELEGATAFRPHLTLVQQLSPDQLDAARPTVQQANLHVTFDATEASLVGRRIGRAWETLRAFPISAET